MNKSVLLAVIIFAAVAVSPVKADSAQYGQYGPGQPNQNILIDKMVGKPTVTKGGNAEANYVDNYSSSDPRFKPADMVFFRLKVKNTSNTKLVNVQVKDFVPTYIEPVEGPGSFDSNTRTITFGAGDFNAGEEKTYYLKMKVLDQNKLPSDKGIMCIVNKAQAYTDKAFDDDTAQFCVEKQVQGATKVPQAGPEMGIILFAGQLAALATGVYMKKRS